MGHNYSFVVLKYLFWNELTFLAPYDVIMNNVSSEAVLGRCSSKMVFLNILQYSQEDACVGVFFSKLAGRLQHRCFLVNIAKNLRAAFLQNTSVSCFWFHYRNIRAHVFLQIFLSLHS